MIKLNRTTEYGLMALRHMKRKATDSPATTSAREIAEFYGLPFEITAKTLQRMKETGLIRSVCGARGGYALQRSLQEISLGEFLNLMEGPQSVVSCVGVDETSAHQCAYRCRCEMRQLMDSLNLRVQDFLAGIRLSELVDGISFSEVSKTKFEGESYEVSNLS